MKHGLLQNISKFYEKYLDIEASMRKEKQKYKNFNE